MVFSNGWEAWVDARPLIEIPAAAERAGAPAVPAGERLLAQLGWRARRRPSPRLSQTLAAGGGALVALGVVVLGVDAADDGSGTTGALPARDGEIRSRAG